MARKLTEKEKDKLLKEAKGEAKRYEYLLVDFEEKRRGNRPNA